MDGAQELRRPAPASDVARPAPVMPSACASGGCGGPDRSAGTATIRVHRSRPDAFVPVLVNGVEIPPQAIAEEAQQHPSKDPETAWRAAARALAIRELLLQEARRLGLEPEPEEDEDGRVEVDEEALVRMLLEREAPPAVPTEEECRRWHAARGHVFRTPDLFEASHILIEPAEPDDAGWAAAEEEARAIADAIGNDREAFAEAAREFSKCPSAIQGGSLGQVRRGELVPVVQAAIEALTEGTTGREPVRSRFGWHVLRLDKRIPGRDLPFEMVKGRIADMLEARAWAMAAARYVVALAARAEIEGVLIDPSALETEAAA